MKYKKEKLIILHSFLFFLLPFFVHAAVEDLDEIVLRKDRINSAVWDYSILQDDGNNFTWQPETFNYFDINTSNEVWRFTSTPNFVGGTTQDIAKTHWSADGNRLLFHSQRASNAFPYANGVDKIWMLSNTDGSRLKPAKGAAAQLTTVDTYPLWSPILSDVLYQGNSNDGQATSKNVLYKVEVSDDAIIRNPFLTISPANFGFMSLKKAISGDGRKVQISADGKFYPVTVFPEISKGFDTPVGGYSSMLNFDFFWGTSTGVTYYHDQYLTGAVNGVDDVWNLLMPETALADGPFWKAKIIGSGLNGAPSHVIDHDAPYDWGGEIEPVNTVTDTLSKPSPWCNDGSITPQGDVCMDAFGHGSPDRWGRYVISSKGGNFALGAGVSFWDVRLKKYESILSSGIKKVVHPDWEAWSDWSITSGYPSGTPYPPTWEAPTAGPLNPQGIWLQNYKTASQKNLAFTHSRYNNTGNLSYSTNARPTQSPDGTKALFSSTFMNSTDSGIQLFWTVAYYPYAPEIKSASKNGANVNLVWDFNQGFNCSNDAGITPRTGPTPNFVNPRTYATRGWPHETLDCPPAPREIKDFRVWSSDDNSNWTPVGTAAYSNCKGTNECGMWTESSWNKNITQANNTTKYYAITSLEHSGLESHTLSNTWKVTTDNSGNIIENVEQNSYPADPGGKTTFFPTSPDAPINITSTHDSGMQYTINWNAPTNKSLIRYYNIYALDGSAPTAVQQRRIASIPATSDYANSGSFKYIDWAGNSDASTQYLITSVDFQGNESGIVTSTDVTAPSAPSGLSVI